MLLNGDVLPPVVARLAQFFPGVGDQLVQAILDQSAEIRCGRQLGAFGK